MFNCWPEGSSVHPRSGSTSMQHRLINRQASCILKINPAAAVQRVAEQTKRVISLGQA